MNNLLTIVHPGVETTATSRPQLARRLISIDNARIGLLDNGKVNAGALLKSIAAKLQALGAGEIRAWKKQHAAEPADTHIPAILAWKPDLVLVAVGD